MHEVTVGRVQETIKLMHEGTAGPVQEMMVELGHPLCLHGAKNLMVVECHPSYRLLMRSCVIEI